MKKTNYKQRRKLIVLQISAYQISAICYQYHIKFYTKNKIQFLLDFLIMSLIFFLGVRRQKLQNSIFSQSCSGSRAPKNVMAVRNINAKIIRKAAKKVLIQAFDQIESSHKLHFFLISKRPIFLCARATFSDLPSNIREATKKVPFFSGHLNRVILMILLCPLPLFNLFLRLNTWYNKARYYHGSYIRWLLRIGRACMK